MKILSRNQTKFAVIFFFLTIVLHISLTTLLNLREFHLVWILIPLYMIPVFLIGWKYGKKDNQILPLAATAFKFHLCR